MSCENFQMQGESSKVFTNSSLDSDQIVVIIKDEISVQCSGFCCYSLSQLAQIICLSPRAGGGERSQ